MEADRLREEVLLTYCLLFGRDERSREIAVKILGSRAAVEVIRGWDAFFDSGRPDLRDFHFYRPHLAHLQGQMLRWKPKRLSELFVPGYHDRLTWFTAIFGLVVGILGALSLFISFIQLGIAIVALKLAQEE